MFSREDMSSIIRLINQLIIVAQIVVSKIVDDYNCRIFTFYE